MGGDEIDWQSLDIASLKPEDWQTLIRHATRCARIERSRVVREMLRQLFTKRRRPDEQQETDSGIVGPIRKYLRLPRPLKP